MADNTRKTSNIIHEVADLNSTVNNLAQNIENNTESIGNIKVYDSHIWLSTSNGLTVTQDGNTTTNNDQPTEWKLEADTNYLNNTLNFATQDDIPSVYVKDIQSGDITTLQVTNDGNGTYTLTATGGGGSGGGGGFENITLAEGTCIDITTEPYDDNGTAKTKITVAADTDCLNTTLNFAKPTDIGNGNITLSPGTGISVTGSNATANQQGNSGWTVAVNNDVALKSDIPSAVEPGNGAINLTGGTGIDVTGANGTANQTSNSSQTISIDSTVALKTDIPTIPNIPSVPDNIVETLNNLTGNLTLESSDDNIVVAEDGTDKINLTLNASLDDLNNVSTGTPSDNQVLTWDGSNWTSQNASGGTFKTINSIQPDESGNFNISNGTGIDVTAGTNNLTLDCTVKNTDTGILTLTNGSESVPSDGRTVEFTSSDASVQYTLTDNKIDLTVPAAGLDIRGTVQYRGPETSNGIYENGGEDYKVLWDADTYLDTATSGVANPSLGDMWIVQYEEEADDSTPPGETFYGHGYIFAINPDPSSDYIWQDAGRISGPPGQNGTSISLEDDVTVNSNSSISSSNGEFVENISTPGEYALTLNIAPSDVNADCVKSLNGMNEAINITSSDSFLNITNSDSASPKTIDLTLQSVANGGQNLALKTDIKDGKINMTASNGVKMSTGSANATANQQTDTEFKIEANYTEIAENIAVGNLSNVCSTAPEDKQVLAWDNTNSTWCPANPTAAAALPISDNRTPTTVTLSSPSENVFEVTADSGSKFSGQIQCNTYTTADGDSTDAKILLDDNKATITTLSNLCKTDWNGATGQINSVSTRNTFQPYGQNSGLIELLQADGSTSTGQLYWYTNVVSGDSYASVGPSGVVVVGFETLGLVGNGINFASNIKGDGKTVTWEMDSGGNLIGTSTGQIQCDTYTTADGAVTDAKIELGTTTAKISVGDAYYAVYSTGYHVFQSVGSQSRFTNDGRFLVNTQTIDSGYLSTFRQNKTGETGLVRFVTNNADGTCSLYVDCDPATNKATFTTTNSLVLATGDVARLEIKNGSHPYGIYQTATGGGSNASSYYQANNCTGAKASHVGINIKTEAVGDGNTIANGFGVVCNAPDDTNAITGEWRSFSATIPKSPATTSYGFYAGAGNFMDDHWAFYAEDQLKSYFGGGINCNTYTTVGGASNGAKIELGTNVTVSTDGQAELKQTDGSSYVASTPDSVMTKKNVEDILTGSGGGDGGQLPGNGSNFIWQKVQIWQPEYIDSENQPVQNYRLLFGCDGVFTDGLHWTTDGENWRTSNGSLQNGLFTNTQFADRVVKSYAENLYWCDNYFSYDMKNWNASNFTGYYPFYFDGHLFEGYGGVYFDPTGPSRVGTSALYGKTPILPDGITELTSYYRPSAGEPTGSVAFRIGYSAAKAQNVLLQLKKDEIGNADWGWNQIDLPGDDEPFNVLFANGKFYVFCSQKVYVSSTASSTNFTPYGLSAAANWDLVCYDGVSITAASSTGDISIFSRDNGATWNASGNFQNVTQTYQSLAGTNGRTLYAYSSGTATDTDETTGVVTQYTIYEYLRTGVGTVGDETLVIGGGALAQTGSVYLAEPVDTDEQNGWWNLGPTIRRRSGDYPDVLPPEPAVIRTQEQANSLFSNKIYQLSHDKASVEVLTQAEYDAIPADDIDDNTLYLITG